MNEEIINEAKALADKGDPAGFAVLSVFAALGAALERNPEKSKKMAMDSIALSLAAADAKDKQKGRK